MKVITVEIPNYLRRVKLSEARKTKYYFLNGKGGTSNKPKAKKYSDRSKYEWRKLDPKSKDPKTFLYDKETNERVVANPRSAGTPRYMIINGQKIYNGEMSKHIRSKVLASIKQQFTPFVDKLPEITTFPFQIDMEIHDVIREPSSKSLWDVDNRAWPYIKAFQDCLTGNRDKNGKKRCKQVIPDDNVLFIPSPPSPKFIPVDSEDKRKLVFRIRSETDKRITTNKEYKEELKNELDEYNT